MKFWAMLAAVAIGTMAGCGGDENQDRIDAILALTGDAATGDTAFQASCAECHNADATGGSGPSIAGNDDSEGIASQVLNGGETMPALPELSDQQIADIIAWLQSL